MPPTQHKLRIVAIGEILWDLFPDGKVLGGAPANFAFHAHALGAEARLISRIGDDEAGHEIMADLRSRAMPTGTIQVDASARTGLVTVEVGPGGHPQYTIHQNVAWDYIEANATALEAVRNADAICFGTLAQRTKFVRATVEALLAASRPEALRIFDINLRPPYVEAEVIAESLSVANVLKLNEQELPVLADLFRLSGDVDEQLAALAQRFSLKLIALTRGGDGSILLAEGKLVEQVALPTTVRDTVGAGDSFTAAVACGLLRRWPLEEICQRASAIAAYVCSHAGATPPLPEELRRGFVE